MINGEVVERIKKELNAILPNVTLDYAHERTGLSIEGIRKAASVTNQFRPTTAKKLAQFIEEESKGEITARDLLEPKTVDFRDRNLRGANLSDEDLSGADFTGADMREAKIYRTTLDRAKFYRADMRNAEIVDSIGIDVDMIGVNFRGGLMSGVVLHRWDMSVMNMQDSSITRCLNKATMTGTDLFGAELLHIDWPRGGGKSRGIILPEKIDFSTWKNGCGCHALMGKMLAQEFPGDAEIDRLIDYILAQPSRFSEPAKYPCYDGVSGFIQAEIPHRLHDIFDAVSKYPEMRIADRLELGLITSEIQSAEEMEGLKQTKYYEIFAYDIDLLIRKAKREFKT